MIHDLSKQPTRVVSLGNSLSMAGIATCLGQDANLEVICLGTPSDSVRQQIREISPSAVVFDLTDPSIQVDIALLYEHAGHLLIGVDPCSIELLVLQCHPVPAFRMDDLIGMIQQNGI